jgi:anti-sigma-K factor RskA
MTGADHDIPDADRALAAEYVLGLLPPAEAAAFADRLDREPALMAEVVRWNEHFAPLAGEVAPVVPPARLRRALEARLFGAARPRRRWFAWAVPLGAAALVALVLVLSPGVFTRGPQPPADPTLHADLATTEAARADGSFVMAAGYDAVADELYVEPRGAAPLPGRVLELWLIAGDDAPVSLGVLPDGPVRLAIAPDLRPRLAGATLAISDEPPGGSPTGQPSGAVLATGPLTEL